MSVDDMYEQQDIKPCYLCKRKMYPQNTNLKSTAPYWKYGYTCPSCFFKIEKSIPDYIPYSQHIMFFNSKPLSFFKIRKVKNWQKQ